MSGWEGKAEQVYRRLRREIVEGTLRPGEQLPEADVVARTGASRTPVREALRRLAGDGLVRLAPRRAPTVTPISLGGARALFEFRRLLEPAAIAAVAARVGREPGLAGAYRDARDRFERLRDRSGADGFAAEFAEAAERFDALLAEHTPNDYLGRAVAELRPHSARLRHVAHTDAERLVEAVAEHVEMCTLVLAADPDGAAAAMTRHLAHVEESIFRRLLATWTTAVDL